MKLKALVILMISILGSYAYSEDQKLKQIDSPWEYVVISFGKAYFEIPEKTMPYKTLGIENGNEAVKLQHNLDILGRFGWEVVCVIGAIGGDQEIILKRRYNENNSTLEMEAIKKGAVIYIQDLIDAMQPKINKSNKIQMIELDEYERAAKKIARREEIHKFYTKQLESNSFLNSKGIISKMETYYNIYGNYDDYYIGIILLVPQATLIKNGNQYRKSEVEGMMSDFLNTMKIVAPDSQYGYTPNTPNIGVKILVKIGDDTIELGTKAISRSSYNMKWEFSNVGYSYKFPITE